MFADNLYADLLAQFVDLFCADPAAGTFLNTGPLESSLAGSVGHARRGRLAADDRWGLVDELVVYIRAAGEATVIHPGGRRSPVHAVEVPPDEAGAILRRALEPYRQSHLLRRLLGSRVRPPVALLRRYRIRVEDTPEDYLAEAQRHPLFELRAT